MASVRRIVTESPRLRKVMIPAYRAYARVSAFSPGPRVLANSLPKSGTHLVAALLANFPKMMFSGRHHTLHHFEDPSAPPATMRNGRWDVDWDRLNRALGAVNPGQFMTGHFPAVPELCAIIDDLGYRTIVIMRDPRDVAVSEAFYITRLERHFFHDRFISEFSSMEERIMATIRGLPATPTSRGLGSIDSRITRYREWFDKENVYACRFENLIGPNGGGTEHAQLEEIAAIAAHIDRPMTLQQTAALAKKTWSTDSSTFRKGQIGDWRNHFSDALRDAFKEVAGHHLIALGYETGSDW
jgi:hypothetical protein